MVAGRLGAVLKSLHRACAKQLQTELETRASPECISLVMSDFQKGTLHLEMELSLKFAWLRQLP
eukprot:46908-Alexandrium_andersonii.AAC.1